MWILLQERSPEINCPHVDVFVMLGNFFPGKILPHAIADKPLPHSRLPVDHHLGRRGTQGRLLDEGRQHLLKIQLGGQLGVVGQEPEGVVELDASGYIVRFVEKPEHPSTNLALIGVYHIDNSGALADALDRLVREKRQARGEFWLADGLQLMVDAGEKMRTFPMEHWYDCGTAESLLIANHDLLDLSAPDRTKTHDTTIVIPPSFVSPTAEIHGSVVGPHVSIAEGASVVNSVIRDSIVNANAEVADALLEHSIVGERAIVKGRPARVNVGDSSAIELT